MDFLLPLLVFGFTSVVIGALGFRFVAGHVNALDRRLHEVTGGGYTEEETSKPQMEALVSALKRVGSRVPRSPAEMGKLRLRLVQAGFRSEESIYVFFGIRVAIAFGLFALCATPILISPSIPLALGAFGLGYVLPGMVLARLAKRRKHRLQLSLADALDLLVVSVEAGLGLDQAMMRVGEELEFAYPELAQELRLVNLELRAGKGRVEALRNLGERTGVEDLASLCTMLIQTDKFGTSVAQSLRVHSDTLRTKRRQRAEEAAAKTGVKMVFPLVLCIFPAIWVVTIGPAAIKFVTVLFPVTSK
ncbi:MAG TPA: type II secretion system F family protein [Vicinamibacterales bacterium]